MDTESVRQRVRSGWKDILQTEHRRPLALISLSVWLHASMVTAMSTLVPDIVGGIGGIALVPWTFALYDTGSILAGAGSGLLAYRYRLRTPMCHAALLFAVGSTLCALADVMPVLMLGRFLQGLGGGGLIALSFIGVSTLFPDHLIPKAMAVVSAIWGVSAFFGPLIGALWAQLLSWRMAFWFFVLMSVTLSGWIRHSVPMQPVQGIPDPGRRFPIRRLSVLTAGVLLIAAGGIEISMLMTPLLVLSGIACLLWFLRMDARSQDDRLFPIRPIGFGSRISAGLTMILCFTMATMAITVYGPLFLVQLHQVSIITAGYVVACSSVGWSLGAIVISGIPAWRDTRAIMIGMTLLLLSIVGFVFAIKEGPIWLLALLAVLEGSGFGIAWASILRRMLALVQEQDRERISAAIPTIQRLGYAIGAAWIGIVANAGGLAVDVATQTAGSVAQGVFLAALPLAGLGLVAAGRFISPWERGKRVV